ncbi:1355_t:CDS:1, partial [Funneliformis mosseae]
MEGIPQMALQTLETLTQKTRTLYVFSKVAMSYLYQHTEEEDTTIPQE